MSDYTEGMAGFWYITGSRRRAGALGRFEEFEYRVLATSRLDSEAQWERTRLSWYENHEWDHIVAPGPMRFRKAAL